MKKVLVDLVGFASLVPISMLYNAVEREWGGFYGVLAAAAVLIPVSVTWHYFHSRVQPND